VSGRLDRIRELLEQHEADSILLTHPAEIRWAVGFSGSNGLLCVTRESAHLITDGRYTGQAAEEVRSAHVHIPGHDLVGYIAEKHLLGSSCRVLISSDDVTLADHAKLEEKLRGHTLVPTSGLVTRLRGVKDESEIEKIRAAQALTERVFDHILPLIGPGVTEQDLAAEIVYEHLKGGASAMAFDPIVASGRRSALPHARASTKPFASGDVVLIDMGCYLDAYASDMTRTVVIAEVEQGIRAAYEAVLEAQLRAIEFLRAGVSTRDVDRAARSVLAEHGLAEYFTHSLGHGVGLQVHEWPRLSEQVEVEIPAGAVVTIEPGVYLPERFGIRIEDLVIVREDGCVVITRTPKELLVL
jgi:Xaa-Pro aminopeptidase